MAKIVAIQNGVTIEENSHITLYKDGKKIRQFLTPNKGLFIKYRQDNTEDKTLFNEGGKAVYWPSDNIRECAAYIAKRCHTKYYGTEAY
jgi:hypothetical protein